MKKTKTSLNFQSVGFKNFLLSPFTNKLWFDIELRNINIKMSMVDIPELVLRQFHFGLRDCIKEEGL